MKQILQIISIFLFVNIYAQNANQLLVEYHFKNDYYSNEETLVVKNNTTLYTNDELNLTNDDNVAQNEDGNYLIGQKKISLKKKSIYGNLKNNTYSIIMPSKKKTYFVKDSLGDLDWKIHPKDTLKIGDYLCTKATLNFRGRDYIAYFTEEIPIPAGPWKFKALPGLILFIQSTSGTLTYSWQVKKIVLPFNAKIDLQSPNNFNDKAISLKEYVGIIDEKHLSDAKILDARAPKDTAVESTKIRRLGIELVYEWEK